MLSQLKSSFGGRLRNSGGSKPFIIIQIRESEVNIRMIAASSAAIVFGLSGSAFAQEQGKSYVAISGAVSLLMDSDNEGAFDGAFTTGEGTTIPSGVVLPDGTSVGWMTEFDTGYSVSAAYGRRYGALRGELELSWQKSGVKTHYDVVAGGIALANEDAGVLITGSPNIGASVADVVAAGQGDVRTIFVMANVIYDFQNSSPITPYIGGGAGVGFVNVNFAPSGVTIIDDNATEFAWQVMAGASWRMTDSTELYAGYRYRATNDAGVSADLFSANLDIKNRTSLVEAGLHWSF